MSINEEELEIFSRQLILNDFNERSFNELQNKEISIVGLGGIGCPLAQYLISCGIKNLNLALGSEKKRATKLELLGRHKSRRSIFGPTYLADKCHLYVTM